LLLFRAPAVVLNGSFKRDAQLSMKARLDVGTDVAMIGAWDAQRGSTPFSAAELQRVPETLDGDAANGHLFFVRMGGDGGGPAEVYVDEVIPPDVQDELIPVGDEFLLELPSGKLVVDGVEHYRASPAAPNGSVAVPAGHYSVRCYIARDAEQPARSEEALKARVGSAEVAYYDRMNAVGCLGGASTLLLFPILAFPLGWKIALAATVVVFISFFHVREWVLKRNPRYQRLDRVVPAFRRENQDPMFVFELRSIRERGALRGGSVSLPSRAARV
jgi:hypothetical protein